MAPPAPATHRTVTSADGNNVPASWTLRGGLSNGFWNGQKLPPSFFANGNFVRFGDPVAARGRYAYVISARGNGYYRIDVEGQAQDASRSTAGGALTVSAYLTAFVQRDVPQGALPGAATFFSDPDVGVPAIITNATLYNTQAGGSPPSIVGNDAAGVTNVPGVAMMNPNMGFGGGSGTIFGAPTPLVGGNSGNPAPSFGQWKQLEAVVEAARTAAAGPRPNGQEVRKIVYASGATSLTNPFTGLAYIRVPAGQPVDSNILRINGSQPVQGVIIVDLEAGATLTDTALYRKNGTGFLQGAFIVFQRGVLNTHASGIHFIDKNGNNADFLQFNSTNVGNALAAISPGFKIASYVVF